MGRYKNIIYKVKDPPAPFKMFRAFYDRPYSFFLDSSLVSKRLGRFSYMGSDPFLVFLAKGKKVNLIYHDGRSVNYHGEPFAILKRVLRRYAMEPLRGNIMFRGGAVGYFSYDLKDSVERLPDIAHDDLKAYDIALGFYDAIYIYDNYNKEAFVSKFNIRESSDKYIKNAINSASKNVRGKKMPFAKSSNLKSDISRKRYAAIIKKAKDYIRAGDIYQVNLSQRFSACFKARPIDIYERLRKCSRAPFSSYLNFRDLIILSSSPERFLMKRGAYLETRPIKGTRPRGRDIREDRRLKKELERSFKDKAEHIMIVDLERNDIGRLCQYGSVGLSESMIIEKYANVFHMVSTVKGRLKDDISSVDCLAAAFPGGSITGAPKVRAMEIIEELESVKRGIYTGAIGYIGFDDIMDTSVTIRTFIIKNDKIYFQVGGGIVADSDPESEYDETIDKARGLMKALGVEKE